MDKDKDKENDHQKREAGSLALKKSRKQTLNSNTYCVHFTSKTGEKVNGGS